MSTVLSTLDCVNTPSIPKTHAHQTSAISIVIVFC